MLGGRITSGSFLGELSVLKEESVSTFLQTVTVTVPSNERSFSKLKLVKTKLRSTMFRDRLESLMLISCETDFADEDKYAGDNRKLG